MVVRVPALNSDRYRKMAEALLELPEVLVLSGILDAQFGGQTVGPAEST
jgi:hypothetical protein